MTTPKHYQDKNALLRTSRHKTLKFLKVPAKISLGGELMDQNDNYGTLGHQPIDLLGIPAGYRGWLT